MTDDTFKLLTSVVKLFDQGNEDVVVGVAGVSADSFGGFRLLVCCEHRGADWVEH